MAELYCTPILFFVFNRFSLDDKSWEVVQPAQDSEVRRTYRNKKPCVFTELFRCFFTFEQPVISESLLH